MMKMLHREIFFVPANAIHRSSPGLSHESHRLRPHLVSLRIAYELQFTPYETLGVAKNRMRIVKLAIRE